MLVFGADMEKTLNDLDMVKSQQVDLYYQELSKRKSRNKILKNAKVIQRYLENYIQQGEDIKKIENAQTDMIKTWRKSNI